jgi:predicted phage terminase large subunit-like protein
VDVTSRKRQFFTDEEKRERKKARQKEYYAQNKAKISKKNKKKRAEERKAKLEEKRRLKEEDLRIRENFERIVQEDERRRLEEERIASEEKQKIEEEAEQKKLELWLSGSDEVSYTPDEIRKMGDESQFREEVISKWKYMHKLKNEMIRKLVVEQDRVDVLAKEVFGLELKDFHKEMLRFQVSRDKALILSFRGSGKTTLLVRVCAVFEILKNPDVRIMIVANAAENAQDTLRWIRQQFEHNSDLREIFGDFVGKDKWDVKEINVSKRSPMAPGSSVLAYGVDSVIQSRHADVLFFSDCVTEENSASPGQRKKLHTFYWKTLIPILDKRTRIYVEGTRWNALDLYGHFMDTDFKDCHQIHAALDENDESIWPEQLSTKELHSRRVGQGPAIFNCQYMNDVTLLQSTMFQYEWFKWYRSTNNGKTLASEDIEVNFDDLFIWQGVDLAISQKETADKFAHCTIGIDKDHNIFVLDYLEDRLTFNRQTKVILDKFEQWDPIRVVIESNAYQMAQCQNLAASQDGFKLRIMPFQQQKDKVSRGWKLAARVEEGKLYLARSMGTLCEHLCLFPNGRYKDLFDALDLAVSRSYRGVRKQRRKAVGLI